MSNNPHDSMNQLRQIAAKQKQAAEQAEARAEEILQVTSSLKDMLPARTFFGGHFSQPYDEASKRTDSGWVVQAALNIPRGLGIVACDTEDYHAHTANDELHELFRPFGECSLAEKAFLNLHVPTLVAELENFATTWNTTRSRT